MPDALLEAVGDRFQILRLLGRGGMGSVYLARERVLDRLVAIKVLTLEIAGAREARERFCRSWPPGTQAGSFSSIYTHD